MRINNYFIESLLKIFLIINLSSAASFASANIGNVPDNEERLLTPINKILALTPFEFKFVWDGDDEVYSANDLIEEIFPSDEAPDYLPGTLLINDNALCIVALHRGEIVGCIVFTFDADEKYLEINTLAVAPEIRNAKLGSLLLLAFNSVAIYLQANTAGLVSSESGKILYESFGFTPLLMNSYEVGLPFSFDVVKKKVVSIVEFYRAKNRKGKRRLGT